MQSQTIRTFFALRLDISSFAQIESGVGELKRLIPNYVKWIDTDTIHVTLKFIAEFDPNHTPIIENILKSALKEFGPVNLIFSDLGVFPNTKNPNVIWLGLTEHHKINKIAGIIDQTLGNYGYDREKRKFSPHLTLGRLKKHISQQEISGIGENVGRFNFPRIDPVQVKNLLFIQSKLTPSGPLYTTLFEIKL